MQVTREKANTGKEVVFANRPDYESLLSLLVAAPPSIAVLQQILILAQTAQVTYRK